MKTANEMVFEKVEKKVDMLLEKEGFWKEESFVK